MSGVLRVDCKVPSWKITVCQCKWGKMKATTNWHKCSPRCPTGTQIICNLCHWLTEFARNWMYADDTTIYYIEKEVEETIDLLNLILSDFKVRCCKNHPTVYTGKTVAMLISSHAFVGSLRRLMFRYSYIHFTRESHRPLVCHKTTCLTIYYVISSEKIFFRTFHSVHMRL